MQQRHIKVVAEYPPRSGPPLFSGLIVCYHAVSACWVMHDGRAPRLRCCQVTAQQFSSGIEYMYLSSKTL